MDYYRLTVWDVLFERKCSCFQIVWPMKGPETLSTHFNLQLIIIKLFNYLEACGNIPWYRQ